MIQQAETAERDSAFFTNLLQAARGYAHRGWCILPARDKKPTVRWKAYQSRRPTEAEIHTWFGNGQKPEGLGVLCGPVSGELTCRDFDDADAYQRWAQEHPELSDNLATVKTHRGYNVYFRSEVSKIITMPHGEGELRGAGFCVLPPSRHPAGIIYEWVNPLPNGPLPKLDPFAVGLAGFTEHSECNLFAPSAPSCSVKGDGDNPEELEQQIQRAIALTLPNAIGKRNRLVFELARQLKAIPALRDARPIALRAYVEKWHQQALPTIRTKGFTETWADFVVSWQRVQIPASSDAVVIAMHRARSLPLPAIAARYQDESNTQQLIALCRELQALHGAEPFYLSWHKAAAALGGVSHVWIGSRLTMLVADGVLEIAKDHTARRATRYRYSGGD